MTSDVLQRVNRPSPVKCVIWDLDGTIWDGTLMEGDLLALRAGVVEILADLDRRGILHSVASRNDHELAWQKLTEFGLAEWFLAPQINFGAKPRSVERIAQELGIGIDALLFVDDDPLERLAVSAAHPAVRVLDSAFIHTIPDRPDMRPEAVTREARQRRRMYQENQRRTEAEESFQGPPEELLAVMRMVVVIRPAGEADLDRCGELVVRTNQLNSTGRPYAREELDGLRLSTDHDLVVMDMADRFGSLGIVGLALVERNPDAWTVKLLLTSCRVMSRGAGGILLRHVAARAIDHGVRCRVEFVRTGRNRLMYTLLKFTGFRETVSKGDWLLFELDEGQPPEVSTGPTVRAEW